MKIGIITLPLHTNYGGILQAYALQSILQRMGYDSYVIQRPWRKKNVWWKFPFHLVKSFICLFVFGKEITLFPEAEWNKNQTILERNTQLFINRHIHTYQIEKMSDIKGSDFDTIVVGSDQIWRPKYYRLHYKHIEDAFLSFAENWNIKRVAYAPSFGTDKWEYNVRETQKCRDLLLRFDAVSVREKSGVELCEKYLHRKDVNWVLDPTMLLAKEDYELIIPNDIIVSGDLMCYFLDEWEELDKLISIISSENNYSVFRANSNVDDISIPAEDRIQPPVEFWLASLRDAKFVLTDSYHACVFCILFHKPFVVIGNRNRGYSRFEFLLSLFGLENRLIENASQFSQSLLNPLADEVYRRLDEYKKHSMGFIATAFSC